MAICPASSGTRVIAVRSRSPRSQPTEWISWWPGRRASAGSWTAASSTSPTRQRTGPPPGGPPRRPGNSCPPRPAGHRHQPELPQQPGGLAHLGLPADETRQRRDKPMHAARGRHRSIPHSRTISAADGQVQSYCPTAAFLAAPAQPARGRAASLRARRKESSLPRRDGWAARADHPGGGKLWRGHAVARPLWVVVPRPRPGVERGNRASARSRPGRAACHSTAGTPCQIREAGGPS